VSESAYEDEEQVARGARSPGETNGIDDEIGACGEDRANFPVRMGTNATRPWDSSVGGGFLRTAGHRVTFDPEDPPLPPQQAHQQIMNLLEKPKDDYKVKSSGSVNGGQSSVQNAVEQFPENITTYPNGNAIAFNDETIQRIAAHDRPGSRTENPSLNSSPKELVHGPEHSSRPVLASRSAKNKGKPRKKTPRKSSEMKADGVGITMLEGRSGGGAGREHEEYV
ncbi:hypothetical protein WN55_02715, partial [Dufourea novaeangliae]